jgi:hypothetical protein
MRVQPPPMLTYEPPQIVDFGSIADHTFVKATSGPCGQQLPPKDMQPCRMDKFCEWTCLS